MSSWFTTSSSVLIKTSISVHTCFDMCKVTRNCMNMFYVGNNLSMFQCWRGKVDSQHRACQSSLLGELFSSVSWCCTWATNVGRRLLDLILHIAHTRWWWGWDMSLLTFRRLSTLHRTPCWKPWGHCMDPWSPHACQDTPRTQAEERKAPKWDRAPPWSLRGPIASPQDCADIHTSPPPPPFRKTSQLILQLSNEHFPNDCCNMVNNWSDNLDISVFVVIFGRAGFFRQHCQLNNS